MNNKQLLHIKAYHLHCQNVGQNSEIQQVVNLYTNPCKCVFKTAASEYQVEIVQTILRKPFGFYFSRKGKVLYAYQRANPTVPLVVSILNAVSKALYAYQRANPTVPLVVSILNAVLKAYCLCVNNRC